MAKLITGGTGVIGSEVARQLVSRGEDVVLFDISINEGRIRDIRDKVKIVQGDVSIYPEVFSAVKENGIDAVFHLGAVLGGRSEQVPWASFQTNILGTMNVLEAVRLFDVKIMVYTSSIGSFGPSISGTATDSSAQKPRTIYGISKLYCEQVGRYYREKMGIDFRAVRYPAVAAPGSQVYYHVFCHVFTKPAMGLPYEMPVPPDGGVSLIHYKDAALAAIQLHDAPAENIVTVNYNVAGPKGRVPYRDMEQAVKVIIPGAQLTYSKKPDVNLYPELTLYDDSSARAEWGWSPRYDTIERIAEEMVRETREKHGIS